MLFQDFGRSIISHFVAGFNGVFVSPAKLSWCCATNSQALDDMGSLTIDFPHHLLDFLGEQERRFLGVVLSFQGNMARDSPVNCSFSRSSGWFRFVQQVLWCSKLTFFGEMCLGYQHDVMLYMPKQIMRSSFRYFRPLAFNTETLRVPPILKAWWREECESSSWNPFSPREKMAFTHLCLSVAGPAEYVEIDGRLLSIVVPTH